MDEQEINEIQSINPLQVFETSLNRGFTKFPDKVIKTTGTETQPAEQRVIYRYTETGDNKPEVERLVIVKRSANQSPNEPTCTATFIGRMPHGEIYLDIIDDFIQPQPENMSTHSTRDHIVIREGVPFIIRKRLVAKAEPAYSLESLPRRQTPEYVEEEESIPITPTQLLAISSFLDSSAVILPEELTK